MEGLQQKHWVGDKELRGRMEVDDVEGLSDLLRLDPADEMGAAAVAAQARQEFSFRADAFFPPPEDPALERGLRRRVLAQGAGAAVRSESAAGQERVGIPGTGWQTPARGGRGAVQVGG